MIIRGVGAGEREGVRLGVEEAGTDIFRGSEPFDGGGGCRCGTGGWACAGLQAL